MRRQPNKTISQLCAAVRTWFADWLTQQQRIRQRRLKVTVLEDRRLPDASFALAGGILSLTGFDAADSLSISFDSSADQYQFALHSGSWDAGDLAAGPFQFIGNSGTLGVNASWLEGIVIDSLQAPLAQVLDTADGFRTGALEIRGGGHIELTSAANDFETVTIVADSLRLSDANDLRLSELSVAGDVQITAGGQVSDVAGASINVSGNASFTAAELRLGDDAQDDIRLGTLTFSTSGVAIVAEADSMLLAGHNSALSAVLSSTEQLASASGTTLQITGITELTAADILLGQDPADQLELNMLRFQSDGDVRIHQSTAMHLLEGSTGRNVSLVSDGSINSVVLTSLPLISADELSLSAAGSIGTDTHFLLFDAQRLSANSSGVDGNQYFSAVSRTELVDVDAGSGRIILGGGEFLLLNSVNAAELKLQSGTAFSGSGVLNGSLTAEAGAIVSPGFSPGLLRAGELTMAAGSILQIDLQGLQAGVDYDQLTVQSSVFLAGTLSVTVDPAFNPVAGTVFTIIDNQGTAPVAGTFQGLAEGSVLAVGSHQFIVSYHGGDGNDVVLVAGVPEYHFTQTSYGITEGDSGITVSTDVTLVRSGNILIASSVEITVTAAAGDSATAGDDFVAETFVVHFASGQTHASVPLQIIGDLFPEPDETFTVVISGFSHSGHTGSHPSSTVVVIENDDTPVLVRLIDGQLLITDETADGYDSRLWLGFDSLSNEVVLRSAASDMGTGNADIFSELRFSADAVTGQIIFETRDGDDSLTVNFADGSPVRGTGLSVDGGSNIHSDILTIEGSLQNVAVFQPAGSGSALILIDGQPLSFAGIEGVNISGMAHVLLQLDHGDNLLTVQNGTEFLPGSTQAALRLSGSSGGVSLEHLALHNNQLITIDASAAAGNDTILIAAADNDHGNGSLVILTGTGDDLVHIQGSVSLTESFFVQSAEILISGSAVDTEGTQTYSGAVRIGQSALLSGSFLTFQGSVDSVAGEQYLLRLSGNAQFEGAVGAEVRLLGIEQTGGSSEFRGTVDVGAAGLHLVVTSIRFQNQVTSTDGGEVRIENSGLLTVESSAGMHLDGAFRQQGLGTADLAAGIWTAAAEISFGSPLTLSADVQLRTVSGGGIGSGADIHMSEVHGAGFQLMLNAGSTGNIQSESISGLTRLVIEDSGSTSVQGSLLAQVVEIQRTTGSFVVNGAITADQLVTVVQSYAVILAGGGIVSSATIFFNTSGVTLGNSDDDVLVFAGGVTSQASTTIVQGTVATEGHDLTMGTLILNSQAQLTTGSGPGWILAGMIVGDGVPLMLEAGSGSIELLHAGNVIGDLTVSGVDVTILESDQITQSAAWSVSGQLILDAGNHDIRLAATGNQFGQVNAVGRSILITAASDLNVGVITASEDIVLSTAGSIRNVDSSSVVSSSGTGGRVHLKAGLHIGAVGADVLTTTMAEGIEVQAAEIGVAAGGDVAVRAAGSARITALTADTAFISGDSHLDLSAADPDVRNLSLLAANGTITLPDALHVMGDLRLEAGDFDGNGALRLAAQRTLFRSGQAETVELTARMRDSAAAAGTIGMDPGQFDGSTQGNLTLISIGPQLELADLDGDGASIDLGPHLLSLHGTGLIRQFLPSTANQNSRILAGQLRLTGAADFVLNNPANHVNILAADIDGSLVYVDADGLTIGTVGSVSGLTTTDDIRIQSVGDLTILGSIIAADGIEDTTAATGETIRLESVDGNITIDGRSRPIVISTDENPVRSNPITGDQIILVADSDGTGTIPSSTASAGGTAEGQIRILGDVTISTDGGVARQFGPRPVPGLRDTAFFVFVDSPLPVAVDNLPLNINMTDGFLSAFAVVVGVAGEQNLQVHVDWLDPVDETRYLQDGSIQALAARIGVVNPVSSERIQEFLIADGGQMNLIGHIYTIVDYTLFQNVQNRTTIPVVFSVSHHASISLDGLLIEQSGSREVVPGRALSTTDNMLTPAPNFENGYVEFRFPTFTPIPPALLHVVASQRIDVPDPAVPQESRPLTAPEVFSETSSTTSSGIVVTTRVFLQIRRQFEQDAPADVLVDRITDGSLLSSRSALELFIQENTELQDGSGYEIWLITETGGQRVERPVVEFEITRGRPGSAQDISEQTDDIPRLLDVPFDQQLHPEQQPVLPDEQPSPEQPQAKQLDVPDERSGFLDPGMDTQSRIAAAGSCSVERGFASLPVSTAAVLAGTAVGRFRRRCARSADVTLAELTGHPAGRLKRQMVNS